MKASKFYGVRFIETHLSNGRPAIPTLLFPAKNAGGVAAAAAPRTFESFSRALSTARLLIRSQVKVRVFFSSGTIVRDTHVVLQFREPFSPIAAI